MMKVFIDTNIMVDVLLGRKEFLLQSSNIFQLADNENVSWIHWLKILLTRTKKKLMMMVKKTSDLFYFPSLCEQ